MKKKYLDLSVEEKLCPICGTPLKEIGEEFVRRELVFIPAKLKVYEYYNKSYECPKCKLQDLPVIKKGKDGRAHMLYGMASAGTVAWVMYQKFWKYSGVRPHKEKINISKECINKTRGAVAPYAARMNHTPLRGEQQATVL